MSKVLFTLRRALALPQVFPKFHRGKITAVGVYLTGGISGELRIMRKVFRGIFCVGNFEWKVSYIERLEKRGSKVKYK